jgi:hypothetical protein
LAIIAANVLPELARATIAGLDLFTEQSTNDPVLDRGRAKAADLIRLGKRQKATALIQSLLQRSSLNTNVLAAKHARAGSVIDGDRTRFEPAANLSKASRLKVKPDRAKPNATITPLAVTLRNIAAGGRPMHGSLSG